MTSGTFFRRWLVKEHCLRVDRLHELVTPIATDVAMDALQREGCALVVIE